MQFTDTLSGAPRKLLPNRQSAFKLLDIIYKQLEVWMRVIDTFGKVKCIDRPADSSVRYEDQFHDLVLFGYTKSCKSLMASRILIEHLYQEDAQVILRSVYESYLSLNYVYYNPETINSFVYFPIGVSIGDIKHPTSKKGNKIKNQIMNPATGVIEGFGISIATLANELRSENERKLHESLYSYLCEHTHFNMISSGNYRINKDKKYSYLNYWGYDQPIVLQEYLMIVYLTLMIHVIRLENITITNELSELIEQGKSKLKSHLAKLNLDENSKAFRELIFRRLAESA